MIPSRERRLLYLAVKELSALLTGITSTSNGNFYCLNCLHSFRTKNKLELHKKVYRVKDSMKTFCKSFIEHAIKIVNFKKKKNEIINKKAAGIIGKCKNLLYL